MYVEWSDDEGLVHIIEDEDRFDWKVVFEVFGTMNEIDDIKARSYVDVSSEQMTMFYDTFTAKFKPYDWAKRQHCQ